MYEWGMQTRQSDKEPISFDFLAAIKTEEESKNFMFDLVKSANKYCSGGKYTPADGWFYVVRRLPGQEWEEVKQ